MFRKKLPPEAVEGLQQLSKSMKTVNESMEQLGRTADQTSRAFYEFGGNLNDTSSRKSFGQIQEDAQKEMARRRRQARNKNHEEGNGSMFGSFLAAFRRGPR